MSAEDNLYINSPLDPSQTLMALFDEKEFGQPYITDKNVHSPVASVESLLWSASAKRIEDYKKESVKRRVEIDATLEIWFTTQWSNLYEVQVYLLKVVLKTLDERNWDGILLHGDSIAILLRKQGQLILQKGHSFWTPEHLKLVSLPYEMKDIPRL